MHYLFKKGDRSLGHLVLGIDPGAERTGFCWKMRENDRVWPTLHRGIVTVQNLEDWLLEGWDHYIDNFPHERFFVTIEKFIQRRTDRGSGNWIKQGTPEVYGACWITARRYGARVIPARPDNLSVGARLGGIKWSGKSHLRDDLAAEAHASYLCANGVPNNLRHPIN